MRMLRRRPLPASVPYCSMRRSCRAAPRPQCWRDDVSRVAVMVEGCESRFGGIRLRDIPTYLPPANPRGSGTGSKVVSDPIATMPSAIKAPLPTTAINPAAFITSPWVFLASLIRHDDLPSSDFQDFNIGMRLAVAAARSGQEVASSWQSSFIPPSIIAWLDSLHGSRQSFNADTMRLEQAPSSS